MNKKTQDKIEKIIQRYLRNMQLEMQRYANELFKELEGEIRK